MTKQRFFLSFLAAAFIAGGCRDIVDNGPECVCTAEFRMYRIFIRDGAGKPIDSLDVQTVNYRTGKAYKFSQPWESGIPENEKGVYVVMTDQFTRDLSVSVERFIFTAYRHKAVLVQQDYTFNTDECLCHINKVAGPDTITVQ